MKNYVLCRECKEEHTNDEVECIDISEDIQGRDLIQFRCPVTKTITESFVYRNR